MARRHLHTIPASMAARLSAEGMAELRALQAGVERLVAEREEPLAPDPWQVIADLAQWYLMLALEPVACDVSVDTDRCTYLLGEAVANGCQPTRDGVSALQRAWLASARWPCFPGDRAPPLL